jgi:hypothetical protein
MKKYLLTYMEKPDDKASKALLDSELNKLIEVADVNLKAHKLIVQ